MTKLSIFILITLLPVMLLSQTISNVRVTQNDIGIYKVYYDLTGNTAQTYQLVVTATKDGKTITPGAISGTINTTGYISCGKDLLLLWDPVLDGYPTAGWKLNLSASYVLVPMIYVEGGSYHNGTFNIELDSFYIGQFEITQQQWREVTTKNPSKFKGGMLPVESVNWYDCLEFCNMLSRKEGLTPCYSGSGENITCDWSANGYRLPTEAEWEFAARGGNPSKGYSYSGSNEADKVAWFMSNSNYQTHTVASKQPNELGIYDMSGNVSEWCWDRYEANSTYPEKNPHGPESGRLHIIRGGAWFHNEMVCRITYRDYYPPVMFFDSVGFRVLRRVS